MDASDNNVLKFPRAKKPRPAPYSDDLAVAMAEGSAAALLDIAKNGIDMPDPLANVFTGD